MNPQWKAKWLAALRSGEYKQGHGALYRDRTYCCLGVLCDLVKPNARMSEWAYLPPDVAKLVELSPHLDNSYDADPQTELAWKNDNGFTFHAIADWIEANL